MDDDKKFSEVITLMKQLVKGQEKINDTLTDVINLFKKYEVDEVIESEFLREG